MSRINIEKPAAVTGDANAAIAAERLRIMAILDSPEGKRNPEMAKKLALGTALDAESAKGILAEAPAANPFLEAMELFGPVSINASAAEVSSDPKAARLAEIKQSVHAVNEERRGRRPSA